MNLCPFNLEQAAEIASEKIYNQETYSINNISEIYADIMKEIKGSFSVDFNSNSESFAEFKEFINMVRDELFSCYENDNPGSGIDNWNWLSESRFMLDAEQIILGKSESSSLVPHSSEALVYQKEGKRKQDATDQFINEAYGEAEGVKREMLLEAKTNIVNACFIDRTMEDYETPKTNEKLNDNLRKYQQKLLNNILEFFERKFTTLPLSVQEVINDPTWFKDGKSTGAWEKIYEFAKEKFSNNKYTSSTLNDLLLKGNKLQLDAYNSFILLSNFDSFLYTLFGDGININNFGTKDGSNKYSFEAKTGQLIKNFRTDDNIFLEDEADKITMLLVETTLMLDENGTVIPGEYLTFQDYSYVMAAMKLWTGDPEVLNTIFKSEDINSSSLSDYTVNIIVDKSLSSILSLLRTNFLKYMPAVAELYNSGYLDNLNVVKQLGKKKNKFKTVMSSFFDITTTNSTFNLSDPLGLFNIFRNLCLTSDSMFRNMFTQAYLDTDGTMYNRMLSDLSVYKLRIGILNTINNINSPQLQLDFEQKLKDEYKFSSSESTSKVAGLNVKLYHRHYEVPNGNPNVNIIMDVTTGIDKEEVSLLVLVKEGDKITKIYNLNNPESVFNDIPSLKGDILTFCDLLLGTNFINDKAYFENYKNFRDGTENLALAGLLSYCGRVLDRKYISNVILPKIDTTVGKRKKMSEIYGKKLAKEIGFDQIRNQVNLSGSNNSVDKSILLSLANAKAESMGITTASVVNNSENKAQSNNALSKLFATYQYQWYEQETLKTSATELMDLLKVPGLFKEINIINEVYSKKTGKSKQAVAMTPAEFATTSTLLDFLPALFEQGSKVTSKGLAQFITSVNSDKGTVAKMVINLFTKMLDEFGNTYDYATCDISLIYDDIERNLGTYYSKILDEVLDTYKTLNGVASTFLKEKYNITKIGLFDYINNFKGYTEFIAKLNNDFGTNYTEQSFLNTLLKKYNDENPNNPLVLVLNIHTTFKKGKLIASNTLLGLIYRYNNNGYKGIDESHPNANTWSNMRLFFGMRQLEMIGSLLANNSKFNISNLPFADNVISQYKDWINERGDLIIARVDGHNLASMNDYMSVFGDIDSDPVNYFQNRFENSSTIQINPILQRLNLLHFLFSLQWMATTVGSFIGHPLKLDIDDVPIAAKALHEKYKWIQSMYEESAQFVALSKRNVSFTALMQQFQLNDLRGISDKYKIAVVDDLKKLIPTLTKRDNDVTPWDGATIADPFTVHLENFSLAGNSSGLTKKTFVHAKHEKTGSGIIIKTAVFGLTNDNMKTSPDTLLKLFYKMSNGIWKDLNGNAVALDLTTNDLEEGNKIKWPDDLYFSKNGHFYQILDIDYINSNNLNNLYQTDENFKNWSSDKMDNLKTLIKNGNSYVRTIVEVDRNGNAIGPKTFDIRDNVNSNYKAWELFGGLNSMELKNGKGLIPSENSIKAVVNCMNFKGFKNPDSDVIRTLDDFYQPMKHSQIQYLVTEGAIKQGAANMNPNSTYNDNSDLMHYTIRMLQAGTQLDKEHHADLAEVSLPTLIITACAALGYSFKDADSLYKGISSLAEVALDQIMDLAKVSFTSQQKRGFLNKCTHIIIDNLANSETKNFGTYLAESILKTAKVAKQDFDWSKQGLPISDNTVFNRAINALTNYMTKNAIKLKMPGSLSIMTPSHKMMPIYGDRKFSDYLDPYHDIHITLKEQYDTKPIYDSGIGSIANVEFGHKYKILSKNPIITTIDPNTKTITVNYRGLNYTYSTVDYLAKMFNSLGEVKQFEIFSDKNRNKLFTLILGVDLNETFKELAIFNAIKDSTKLRRKLTLIEDELEYELRMNSEAWEEFLLVKSVLFQGLVEYKELVMSSEPNLNLINYHELKNLVKNKLIISVHEYILDGRDLGCYNVRFNGSIDNSSDRITEYENELKSLAQRSNPDKILTENQLKEIRLKAEDIARNELIESEIERFQMYDLASVLDTHNYKEGTNEYNLALARQRRDLYVLSKYGVNLELKWKELSGLNIDVIVKQAKLLFGKDLFELSSGLETDINALRELFTNTVTVRSINPDGTTVEHTIHIDRNSIEHQDYEAVVPKVYKTTFGLDENTCLAEILNNPYYFVNKILLKLESLIDDSLFNIELKDNNGNHKYIAFSGHVKSFEEFRDITQEIPHITDDDGKIFRVDEETGDLLYEIKEGMKIYANSLGTEIILLSPSTNEQGEDISIYDTLAYLLKEISGNDIYFSNNINTLDSLLFIEVIKNSRFGEDLKEYYEKSDTILDLLDSQSKISKITITDIDYVLALLKNDTSNKKYLEAVEYLKQNNIKKEDYINKVRRSKQYINGMEQYNSFIESLKIIAARIPSQNMASFMGMKIVGFSNGDRNTAYVSDHQIFLQGSDFDIDSVTLLSYDLNDDGKLEFWSPYAALGSKNSVEESKKLPFPTGKSFVNNSNGTLEFINSKNDGDAELFFDKFIKLFNFTFDDKGNITKISMKFPRFSRNSDLLIKLYSELFNTKELYLDVDLGTLLNSLDNYINGNKEERIKIKEVTYENVNTIVKNLKDAIDRHNTYLSDNKHMTDIRRRKIINNSNLNSMYNIISDPINLQQSMTSVDSVTKPAKKRAKDSDKALKLLYLGPGNFNSYGELIYTNYVGKNCIAKSASSIKAFFKLTHYFNSVLNLGDEESLKSILPNPAIFKRCGEYRPILANIKATDPSSIVSDEVLDALLNGTAEDASLNLSALLGLSADNAKELVLDKINAGIDMIGLYLYGISVGFSIPLLSLVLMSRSSDILLEAMKSDFISGKFELDNYKIFEYFNKGPKNAIKPFNVNPERSGEHKDANQVNVAIGVINKIIDWVISKKMTLDNYGATLDGVHYLSVFYNNLHPKNGEKPKHISNDLISKCINDFVNLFCNYDSQNGHKLPNDNRDINSFYKAIDFIKSEIPKYTNQKTNYVLNDFIEFIKQFGRLKIELYNERNHNTTDTLLILSTGSKSMLDIGLICSLNQGLPNNLKTLIKKINLFELFTQNQYKMYQRFVNGKDVDENTDKMFKYLNVDLIRFIHDEDYRKNCITDANAYKINFNLFHMVDTLPDVKQYINALGLVDLFFKTSSVRYKFIRDKFKEYYHKYLLKPDELTEAMSKYMQSVFIQEYLKDETKRGFRFPILEGSRELKNGKLSSFIKTTTEMTGIDSTDNIAYFKYWMESRVIPELKTRNNEFLLNLLGSSRNNTISGNELIAYTLLINMMPKKEGSNEDIIFKKYLNLFNNMQEVYNYTNPKTGEKYNYSVKDLLFYYALTAFEWKPSQQSLMQIFKTALSSDSKNKKVEAFFKKIQELEQSDLQTILDTYPIEQFMATKNMLSNPNATLIWKSNIETGRKELYKKTKKESKNLRDYNEDLDPSDFDSDDVQDDEGGDYVDDYIEEVDGEWVIKDNGIQGYEMQTSFDPNYYMFGKDGGISPEPITLKDIVDSKTSIDITDEEWTEKIKDFLITLGAKDFIPNDEKLKEIIDKYMPVTADFEGNKKIKWIEQEIKDDLENKQPDNCDVPF